MEGIHCVQVYDVKEAVHEMVADSKVACFISQGTGIKARNLTLHSICNLLLPIETLTEICIVYSYTTGLVLQSI